VGNLSWDAIIDRFAADLTEAAAGPHAAPADRAAEIANRKLPVPTRP
jgi:hypothetical protein